MRSRGGMSECVLSCFCSTFIKISVHHFRSPGLFSSCGFAALCTKFCMQFIQHLYYKSAKPTSKSLLLQGVDWPCSRGWGWGVTMQTKNEQREQNSEILFRRISPRVLASMISWFLFPKREPIHQERLNVTVCQEPLATNLLQCQCMPTITHCLM